MNQKKKLVSIYISVPFGIAIIVCFITNYAIDRTLNWSLIAAGGCVFAYLLLLLALTGGKHRVLLLYGAVCILTIPYLYLIELVANQYLAAPQYWVSGFAAPVSICWLAIFGLLAVIRKLTKLNACIIAGISILGIYAGERFTNMRMDQLPGVNDSWSLSDQFPVVYFGMAAIFIFIGIVIMSVRHIKHSPAEQQNQCK
ncbi:hypothetical protein [Anaerolentibacter hominis]|uniref:hypothetical protein n=1 Tax=Anaerolentibacter hominis TaxID=3079009 RepID=UPI0031B83BF4